MPRSSLWVPALLAVLDKLTFACGGKAVSLKDPMRLGACCGTEEDDPYQASVLQDGEMPDLTLLHKGMGLMH